MLQETCVKIKRRKGEEMRLLLSVVVSVVLLAAQANAEEKQAFQTTKEKQEL